ncbi:MAG: hypothetical protein WAJ85_14495 [Candidatus Baltobacteraceae bacterium]|jgi:hypothetical protein
MELGAVTGDVILLVPMLPEDELGSAPGEPPPEQLANKNEITKPSNIVVTGE